MSREMKYSGIPWIGDIPRGWVMKRLKDVGFLYGGLTGKAGDDFIAEDDESCNYMRFIPFTNIFNNTIINPNQLYKVRIEDGEKQNLVNKNDILFLMSSEDYDGVGKPAILEEQIENLSLNSFCKGFRVTNVETHPKYLLYLLLSHVVRELVRQEAKGFIRINLRQDKLSTCPIMLPSLLEQQKIASFLDRKCSEIDEMIALQEKVVEELKAYKQSVITEAVTKGLNPDAPMKDSGIEWIGEIPEHWEMYRIKYNTFLKGRIGWQGLNSSDFIDEGYCLITGTDFDNKGGINWNTCYRISKERFDEDELLHIKNGDLLMTKDGTVGKMAYIKNLPEEASLNSHLLIIRQTTEQIDNEFLYWVMLSNVFKRFCSIYQSGSIMSSISQSTLGLFSCYCPTKSEQKAIAQYLDTKCTEIDNLISIKLSKIDSLKEYKKSIIYEYVTGKKEVIE